MSKKAQLNTIMFFLAVASLVRFVSDLKQNGKELQVPPVQESKEERYERIYNTLTNVPEENQWQNDRWNDGMIDYTNFEDRSQYDLWRYEMPRMEFWEWEDRFFRGRR